ncbi:DUF1659 domain-containing protein [Salirhabdus sp. Marseille-P4669]|uniref:DUF1659 domain-containing protein n=1 Tax=Salirhabdus sp. Marseille-P4669 TaxID=2042310 RepID=UPI000C7AF498|nr:DUF1659 domain-containing protein [Salirhabdus sp. Marseille-P4669]
MASTQIVRTQLQLVFQTGTDEEGKAVLKNKNFNNIKITATPDQLYAVANAVVPLQEWTLQEIERNDTSIVMA